MGKRKRFIQFAVLAAAAFVMVATGPSFAADKLLCGSTATTSSHYVYTVSAGKAINAVSGDRRCRPVGTGCVPVAPPLAPCQDSEVSSSLRTERSTFP